MKKYLIPLLILILASPVYANGQGFESIDCLTRVGKDTFTPTENVCVKETIIRPGGDCGDPNDVIQVYVLTYRTNYDTPDGSFFYSDGRSLVPYAKKIAITINADRSIYWNLGQFNAGSYDIAQGGNDYRGNDLYQGGCIDELGSPLVSAGFDVIAAPTTTTQASNPPCSSDFNCQSGYYCHKGNPYFAGVCLPITTTTSSITATTIPSFTTTTISSQQQIQPRQTFEIFKPSGLDLMQPVYFGSIYFPIWFFILAIIVIVVALVRR